MARRKYPTLSPETLASDVSIEIWPEECCTWRGTAAQLIAEGLVPANFVDWPARYESKYWEGESYKYWLRRERPTGAKGPRRLFEAVDHWRLQVELKNRKILSGWDTAIRRKQDELQTLVRQRDFTKHSFNRYWTAHRDAKFQAFLDAAIYA